MRGDRPDFVPLAKQNWFSGCCLGCYLSGYAGSYTSLAGERLPGSSPDHPLYGRQRHSGFPVWKFYATYNDNVENECIINVWDHSSQTKILCGAIAQGVDEIAFLEDFGILLRFVSRCLVLALGRIPVCRLTMPRRIRGKSLRFCGPLSPIFLVLPFGI